MQKTINISGIECNLKSSAAIPRLYRLKFHRDIIVDMQRLTKKVKKGKDKDGNSNLDISDLTLFENIAYLFHKHGDPSQPNNIEEWLDQFEFFDIYEIFPEILDMWRLENVQMSKPKKKRGK